MKSDKINTIAFFWITLRRNLSDELIFVLELLGLNSINSLIILKICFLPLLGGMNNSISSVKSIAPTLSLFFKVLKDKVEII